MKIFVRALIFFAFLSCKKNDTATTSYFISSTNNGVYSVNRYNTSASIADAGGIQNSCILLASNDSTTITLNIKSQNTLNTTATYSDISSSDNASLIYTIKGHEQTSEYATPGSLKVNFININSETIEGTFSASVANASRDSITSITGGKFLLPL